MKYKGVSHNKTNNKYAAGVSLGSNKIHLGYYDDPHSAALAYNIGSQIILGLRPALLLNQVPPEHQPAPEQVQKIEELVRWYIEQARTKGRLPGEPV